MTTAKQARPPLHTTPTPARLSQSNAGFNTHQIIAAFKSTSSLLSSMQLFQQPPSAIVNQLRLEYHVQIVCLPAALSLHRWATRGCMVLPACKVVYQLAQMSTNLHLCPPTCKGVHQPARVSTNLQGCPAACQTWCVAVYGQLDSRFTESAET